MFPRAFISTVCVAALLLAGCRTDPYVNAHIESVNAEYRQLENKLYVSEDENRRLQADLARLEEENRRLRGGEAPPSRGFRGRSAPAIDGSIDLGPPEIEMGADTGPSVETPGIPPVTSPPIPRSPETDGVPRRTNRESLDPPTIEGPSFRPPAPGTNPKPPVTPAPAAPAVDQLPEPEPPTQDIKQEPEPIDTRVTQIFLNPLLTGGDSLDSEPGDDGLSILVEPRNKQNQFVPQPGTVSVVVLDPSKEGNAARVARWDFDPAATREKLNRVSSARGIHLRMPWPANPPATNKLKVFVRYETADGRKLQADREVNITLPGQYSHRWTPRPPDRPRRAPEQVAAKTAAPSKQSEPTPANPEATPKPPTPSAQPTPATSSVAESADQSKTAPAERSSPTSQATRPVPQWSPYR